MAGDGRSFAVRAERQGGEADGRRYAVTVVGSDASGNVSSPSVIGYVLVPRDQREHPNCRRAD